MQKEIGSNFWLTPDEIKSEGAVESPSLFGINGSDFVWLSSGRSAIAMAIEDILNKNPHFPKTVCLPSFTCSSVYEPFYRQGFKVKTYSLDKNLQVISTELIEQIRNTEAKVVLIHRYFGFDTIPDFDKTVEHLHNEGIIVIEDVTQCLYSGFDHSEADYCLGSIRKWCGVPDGGFIITKKGSFQYKPKKHNERCETLKVEASLKKYYYITENKGSKNEFLKLYSEAETALGDVNQYYAISPVSESVQANLDIQDLKEKRRSNYLTLLNALKHCVDVKPVFTSLPENVVPLYFPVRCDNRSKVQTALREADIYAPVVWPKEDDCPETSGAADDLYGNLLCLPIDQRYDADDMARMADVILNHAIRIDWLSWTEIEPFRQKIIDWELEVIIKYHYPDRTIPRSFCEEKVEQLQEHLKNGNTFFLGIMDDGQLVGYYWGYFADFLFERTWFERTAFLSEDYRRRGLGLITKEMALKKAKEMNCIRSESMYAPDNISQKKIYERLGYNVSRVEVIKKL